MQFDLIKATAILERTPIVLNSLLEGIPEEWVYKNEGGDTWHVFDVVGHLVECERSVFMPRVNLIMSGSEKPFNPIDMQVHLTGNKGRSLSWLLNSFRDLRAKSLELLEQLELTAPDFERTGNHPKLGKVTLRELLATWTAHDLTHLSQVGRVMARQYTDAVGPFREFFNILK